MSKKRKEKIEFRYYQLPEGVPILALLGQKWVQSYGRDIDYLHFHNYMEIGYCYEGVGTLTLGEKNFRFEGDEFTIIPKNYPHTTNSDPGTVSKWEYLFIDEESLLREVYKGGMYSKRVDYIISRINSHAIFKPVREYPKWGGKIRDILDIMRETQEFYIEEAKAETAAMLMNVARENKGEKIPIAEDAKLVLPISRALDYITLHYMEPLKVEDLADWCHISETHFRRVFTSYMHMKPLDYINHVRIQMACDFLKRTDEPIAAIANKCGFTTLSTFNRNFKQVIGVSPSEWRKRPENSEWQLMRYWIHSEEGW